MLVIYSLLLLIDLFYLFILIFFNLFNLDFFKIIILIFVFLPLLLCFSSVTCALYFKFYLWCLTCLCYASWAESN